jgi:MoaA/NifB/PqqE/SkfB family radical SAM enzyme
MTDNAQIKEQAVKEKRVWVRLTRCCNNGCLFCLDSDSHDGSFLADDVVEAEIEKGRLQGGQRLILSGGEPTIHPSFLRFVDSGRKSGYHWIQTITNGRMFSYRKLADRAIAAGLNEATFSLHGHNPELHDKLVGVAGAFQQSLAGLTNLAGRIVVNVDVVLNRLNLPHLREILEFYIGLGVTEFDLLHMVPFGRAWNENRELLFYDPAAMAPYLRKAFELRESRRIIIWTNRLPAPFLEGCEDLIQDPHKLHDEVRGRMAMFEQWRDQGLPPVCMDDRCPACPMDLFCRSLAATLSALARPPGPAGPERAPASRREPVRCGGAATRDRVIPLERGLEPVLASLSPSDLARVCLQYVPRQYLSECRERNLTPAEARELAVRFGLPIRGLPVCLGGIPEEEQAEGLDLTVLGDDGRLDLVAFTDRFICQRYRVKSLRCVRCSRNERCTGLHINTARHVGLAVLEPDGGC